MKGFNLLNQFLERKCEVSFHSLLDEGLSATYIYGSFWYELDEDYMIFSDCNEEEHNTSFKIDNIIDINNISDDVYWDVVSFKSENYMVKVCLMEDKPVLPKCFKCGREIDVDEIVWGINGNAGYESNYDDYDDVMVLNSLKICDECLYEWVGEVRLVG